MDNQTLILALKNGSEEAFTSLYHKYCDKVYKFCRLYYTNDSTTEEVVQEVFIKLWDIRSYVNENFYKMSILAAYDKAYDIEEELHAKDLRIYIERLVNELPPRQKEVFYLSRHEQLSYKEIAERLDITPKTVERHINEALKYLKKNIYFLQLFLAA